MNRQRYVRRNFQAEGSERSQQLGYSLASMLDPETMETLVQHIVAMHEFGGQIYIASARHKFNSEGEPVEHNEPGSHETVGFAFHYSHKAQLKGQEVEPDVAWGQAEAPTSEQNGTEPDPEPEPEPVTAEAE